MFLDASRDLAAQGERMMFLAVAWIGASVATISDVDMSGESMLDRVVNQGALGAILAFLLWFVIRPAIMRLVASTERLHERLGNNQERILENQVEIKSKIVSLDERLEVVERDGCSRVSKRHDAHG